MSESEPFKREQLRLLPKQEKRHICRKTSDDDVFCQNCGRRFQDPGRTTASKLASIPVGLVIASSIGSGFFEYFPPLIIVFSIVFGTFAVLRFVFHVSDEKLKNYALLIAGSTAAFILVGLVLLLIFGAFVMIGAMAGLMGSGGQ